jgi:hypothetical protein
VFPSPTWRLAGSRSCCASLWPQRTDKSSCILLPCQSFILLFCHTKTLTTHPCWQLCRKRGRGHSSCCYARSLGIPTMHAVTTANVHSPAHTVVRASTRSAAEQHSTTHSARQHTQLQHIPSPAVVHTQIEQHTPQCMACQCTLAAQQQLLLPCLASALDRHHVMSTQSLQHSRASNPHTQP